VGVCAWGTVPVALVCTKTKGCLVLACMHGVDTGLLFFINVLSRYNVSQPVPHQRESDFKGGGIVFEVDDEGEQQGCDEVGQGDDDGGQILVDEVHEEILLQDRKSESESVSETALLP